MLGEDSNPDGNPLADIKAQVNFLFELSEPGM